MLSTLYPCSPAAARTVSKSASAYFTPLLGRSPASCMNWRSKTRSAVVEGCQWRVSLPP